MDGEDLILCSSASSGPGDIVLSGPVDGRHFMPSAELDGLACAWTIKHSSASQIEVIKAVWDHATSTILRAAAPASEVSQGSAGVGVKVAFSAGGLTVALVLRVRDTTLPFVTAQQLGLAGDGVTDDQPVLQAAIDDWSARGGAHFLLKSPVDQGAFFLGSSLTVKSDVTVEWLSPQVHAKAASQKIAGTVEVATYALTANVDPEDDTVTIASTAGFAAGDLIQLRDDRLSAGSNVLAIARRVVPVAEVVNATTLRLAGRARYDFLTASAARIERLLPVENARIIGGNPTYAAPPDASPPAERIPAFHMSVTRDCAMIDCRTERLDALGASFRIERSYNWKLVRPEARNPLYTADGEGYGILLIYTSDGQILDATTEGCRHGFINICNSGNTGNVHSIADKLSSVDFHGARERFNSFRSKTEGGTLLATGQTEFRAVHFGNPTHLSGCQGNVVELDAANEYRPGQLVEIEPACHDNLCVVRARNIGQRLLEMEYLPAADTLTAERNRVVFEFLRNCTGDRLVYVDGGPNDAFDDLTIEMRDVQGYQGGVRLLHCGAVTIEGGSIVDGDPAAAEPWALDAVDVTNLTVHGPLRIANAANAVQLQTCPNALVHVLVEDLQGIELSDVSGNTALNYRNFAASTLDPSRDGGTFNPAAVDLSANRDYDNLTQAGALAFALAAVTEVGGATTTVGITGNGSAITWTSDLVAADGASLTAGEYAAFTGFRRFAIRWDAALAKAVVYKSGSGGGGALTARSVEPAHIAITDITGKAASFTLADSDHSSEIPLTAGTTYVRVPSTLSDGFATGFLVRPGVRTQFIPADGSPIMLMTPQGSRALREGGLVRLVKADGIAAVMGALEPVPIENIAGITLRADVRRGIGITDTPTWQDLSGIKDFTVKTGTPTRSADGGLALEFVDQASCSLSRSYTAGDLGQRNVVLLVFKSAPSANLIRLAIYQSTTSPFPGLRFSLATTGAFSIDLPRTEAGSSSSTLTALRTYQDEEWHVAVAALNATGPVKMLTDLEVVTSTLSTPGTSFDHVVGSSFHIGHHGPADPTDDGDIEIGGCVLAVDATANSDELWAAIVALRDHGAMMWP